MDDAYRRFIPAPRFDFFRMPFCEVFYANAPASVFIDGGVIDARVADPAFRADGVVVAVDRRASMVTMSHEPLQNLGMPPMTMGFTVTDRTSLDALVVGARIRFHADVLDGEFVVTGIERVPQ